MDFKNVDELYKRVLPALITKKEELENSIDEKEIFDILINTKWRNSKNLSLNEVVNDILKFNNYK